MSDISQEMRETELQRQEEDTQKLLQKTSLEKSTALENFKLLDQLYKSAGWAYFKNEVIAPIINEAREKALDIDINSNVRDIHTQQYAFGTKLVNELNEKRAFWAVKAGLPIPVD